jgi:hypothetical protein
MEGRNADNKNIIKTSGNTHFLCCNQPWNSVITYWSLDSETNIFLTEESNHCSVVVSPWEKQQNNKGESSKERENVQSIANCCKVSLIHIINPDVMGNTLNITEALIKAEGPHMDNQESIHLKGRITLYVHLVLDIWILDVQPPVHTNLFSFLYLFVCGYVMFSIIFIYKVN